LAILTSQLFWYYAHERPIILELFLLKLQPIILKIIYAGTLGSTLIIEAASYLWNMHALLISYYCRSLPQFIQTIAIQ